MVLLQRKLYFSKDSEGGPTFFRAVQLFSRGGRGVQMLISIETHITCYFPRGSGSALGVQISKVLKLCGTAWLLTVSVVKTRDNLIFAYIEN